MVTNGSFYGIEWYASKQIDKNQNKKFFFQARWLKKKKNKEVIDLSPPK